MNSPSTRHIFKSSKVGRSFTVITVMFLSVILGMLVYTITTIHKEKSNALMIDLAGRQRMLFQRHLHEVFSTSQGFPANYPSTRELISSTLKALIQGGASELDPKTGKEQNIPPAPTEEILLKLREQQNHFNDIVKASDDLLLLTPDHSEFRQRVQTLHEQTSTLIEIADEAVKQLNAYSELNIGTMVKWESFVAILVAILGMFVTSQGVRDGRRLENEISERKRAESEMRKSQMFLNSIVENIPHMIFVKTAKDLRFVRVNKAGEELLDRSRDALIGKTDHDLFPKEQADFFTAKDKEVLAGKQLNDISEEPIRTRFKGLRRLHTKKIALLDKQGVPEYLLGISEDITERLQAQKSLRHSEERYRALYEDNPSMYFTVAHNGKILSVNKFGAQQLGYSVEELVGLPVIQIFQEDDRSEARQCFKTCLQNHFTVFTWEFRKVRKDGNVIWVKEIARTVSNNNGDIVVLIVCEDISERKEAEKSLREWKALTESILEQLPKGFAYRCLNNKTWDVLYASKGIKEITGHSASDFLNGSLNYDSLMAPGENERVWPMVQDALAKRIPYENEHQIITREGKKKWILARGCFIFDEMGKLLYLDGLNVDITEHKQIEGQLRASEARFRSLIEHVPFCIHEIELDGKISSMNQAGLSMMGIESESQIIGHSYLELAEKHDHERMRRHFAQAVQGQPADFEFNVTSQGKVNFFTKSFVPLRDSDGKIQKIVGISEDITERKLTEVRLRESETKRLEALKQSDALKSALLSSVSHELRTPLTAMKASLSNLMGDMSHSRKTVQQEFLSGIDQEIDYMSHLVGNLLDMSRIESGTLMPRREWHPLEDIIEGALRRVSLSQQTRNIEIHIPEDIAPVFVDAFEMQQVLINLLDNAVKYSSQDSPIRINVRVEIEEIAISISNIGEPIQAQDLDRIFERFYRRQSPETQPIRGTGLGLAICKGIVEAHGGRIWAESLEKETTITFTLPVTEPMVSFSLEGLHKV